MEHNWLSWQGGVKGATPMPRVWGEFGVKQALADLLSVLPLQLQLKVRHLAPRPLSPARATTRS